MAPSSFALCYLTESHWVWTTSPICGSLVDHKGEEGNHSFNQHSYGLFLFMLCVWRLLHRARVPPGQPSRWRLHTATLCPTHRLLVPLAWPSSSGFLVSCTCRWLLTFWNLRGVSHLFSRLPLFEISHSLLLGFTTFQTFRKSFPSSTRLLLWMNLSFLWVF